MLSSLVFVLIHFVTNFFKTFQYNKTFKEYINKIQIGIGIFVLFIK